MGLEHFAQAMAETVGSIMGNHVGRGRYLTEENFSKELYLGENFALLYGAKTYAIWNTKNLV